MKKLMFMLGVAVLAVTTQAATVTWTCSGVYAGNTSDTVSGVAYLFLSTTAKSDVIAAMSGKGAAAASTYLANNALKYNGTTYTWTGSNGSFDQGTTLDPSKLGSGLTVDGSTKYTLYAVIFDTATVTDASKFYVTQGEKAKAIAVGDGNTAFSLGAQGTTARSQAAGNWYAVSDVPEPTSGLLMLVGLGALALRRRRV